MNYVESVLQPNERVLARGTIHWVIYLPGLSVLAAGLVALYVAQQLRGVEPGVGLIALAPLALGVVLVGRAWLTQLGTEIAVTDHRVIYKAGLISRRTVEMNVEQIESVEVEQSILGRVFNYGDIVVHGTGEGLENIRLIADPLRVRSAITAR